MPEWLMIPIDQIGYDPDYYPRVNGKADWLTVHRYTEALKSHAWKSDHRKTGSFPPVIAVKTTGYEFPYLLLDGLHRLQTWAGAGLDQIGVIVEKLPKSKWLARSVELNIDGKRQLDSGDKRWVATKLKAEGWEDGEVAKLLCMEPGSFQKLVATSIQKLTKVSAAAIPIGRSNRKIGEDHIGFLKAPFAEITGTANAQKALREQSMVTSRDAVQIVDSMIALLDSRAIDFTDEDMRLRLERVRALLDEHLPVAVTS